MGYVENIDSGTSSSLAGDLIFAEIPRLPNLWWTGAPANDPSIVWTVWDRKSYYLWGANIGNYQQQAIGAQINGGGMAGTSGPTRGRYHPHYVGVITMQFSAMPNNKAVFDELSKWISQGNNIVVPAFFDQNIRATGFKLSLGTGIGATQPRWGDIQSYLLTHIVQLGLQCKQTQFPYELYWPDLRQQPVNIYSINSLDDINNIVINVL